MRNVKQEIAELLAAQVESLTAEEIEKLIEIPADNKMGDYAFPCFRLAKVMRKAPQMIAADIAAAIGENALFEKVEQVNAYVNMFIDKAEFARVTLEAVCEQGKTFGNSHGGDGKTVIVEYSSPNIAKPFHIGHIRSTVIGASIAKLYEAVGSKVVRLNHLGDYGTQFGKMIVAYRKWGNKEDVEKEPIKTLLSYYVKFHEEAEKDPALEDEARETFTKLEHGAKEETELWQWFRSESLKEFNRVYDMLDIHFDSYNGESFYSDKMPAVIEELKEKGLLKESQGAQIVDLEAYGMTPAL
ncbi:MAG: arginine--tRNA ligase, partial [Firmicutes bacterium]|nr:arginine--tRNA ligase [Bacillota bacterium]